MHQKDKTSMGQLTWGGNQASMQSHDAKSRNVGRSPVSIGMLGRVPLQKYLGSIKPMPGTKTSLAGDTFARLLRLTLRPCTPKQNSDKTTSRQEAQIEHNNKTPTPNIPRPKLVKHQYMNPRASRQNHHSNQNWNQRVWRETIDITHFDDRREHMIGESAHPRCWKVKAHDNEVGRRSRGRCCGENKLKEVMRTTRFVRKADENEKEVTAPMVVPGF